MGKNFKQNVKPPASYIMCRCLFFLGRKLWTQSLADFFREMSQLFRERSPKCSFKRWRHWFTCLHTSMTLKQIPYHPWVARYGKNHMNGECLDGFHVGKHTNPMDCLGMLVRLETRNKCVQFQLIQSIVNCFSKKKRK